MLHTPATNYEPRHDMLDMTHDALVAKIIRERVRPDAQQADQTIERLQLRHAGQQTAEQLVRPHEQT